MNPLSLLGTGGSIIAVLGLVASIGGGATLWFHEHDAKIVAQVAAQQAVVAAQAQHDQDQRTISGLSKAASLQATRLLGDVKIKEAIHATVSTSVCATSPAVRALLDGLRSGSVGGNTDTSQASPSRSVVLPH